MHIASHTGRKTSFQLSYLDIYTTSNMKAVGRRLWCLAANVAVTLQQPHSRVASPGPSQLQPQHQGRCPWPRGLLPSTSRPGAGAAAAALLHDRLTQLSLCRAPLILYQSAPSLQVDSRIRCVIFVCWSDSPAVSQRLTGLPSL